MTNDERSQLITSVNEALRGALPTRVRSISADIVGDSVSLQFVHDGELDPRDLANISTIGRRVVSDWQSHQVSHELVRIDAPKAYSKQLLPIVILAMFEQNENNWE